MATGNGGTLSPQIQLLSGGENRLLADIGRVDPTSIASYREHGGYAGLTRAVEQLGAEAVIQEIAAAGLRGRGGGGFPTAEKWRATRGQEADRRVAVANLMGADPTSFGDRALAEGNPHMVLEGLLIAAFAVGASEAILAVRRDWTVAIERLRRAVEEAVRERFAGYLVLGTDFSCQVSVWEGSGAMVAGEETALLASLAGDRGMPVIRPPFPSEKGLGGAPTVVDAGETLAHAAWILEHSSEAFRTVGSQASPGTKLTTIYGKVAQAGLAEVPLGTPVEELLTLAGGAIGPVKAVFMGGASGGAISAGELGTPYDFETLREAGSGIGLGAVLVTDTDTCMVSTARFFLDWSAREACGKAVPCRIGTRRLVEALDRVLAATPRPDDFNLLRNLSRKIADTALCHLESRAPGPMLSTLDRFPDEYRAHAERGECLAGSCETSPVPPLLGDLPGLEPAPSTQPG